MARTANVRTAPVQDTSTPVIVPDRLEDCWDEPDATRPPRGDVVKLQGAWLCIAGRRRAELLISGNHYTVHFADGAIYMGTISLDPDARPKAMDLWIDEGPDRHRGQTASCVYELDGDTLRWCTAGPGQPRPDAFPDDSDARFLSLLFHREHIAER